MVYDYIKCINNKANVRFRFSHSRVPSYFLIALLAVALSSATSLTNRQIAHAETVINSIQLSHNGLSGVAVNPSTNRVYVSDYTDGLVFVVDGSTNTLITSISVPTGSYTGPGKIAVNPSNNKVYVADGLGGLVIINGATNKISKTIQFTYPPYNITSSIGSVAVNPTTGKVYVINTIEVDVFDGSNDQQIATVPMPNEGYMSDIAVNPVTNMAYVASAETAQSFNNVAVIDGSTNQNVARVGFCSADGVAVNPVTNMIYASNAYRGSFCVVNGATNTMTATLSLANYQTGIAVNPTLNRVYVHVDYTNQLTIIDGGSNDILGTVDVGTSPSNIVVNTQNNLIYVADGTTGTLYVLNSSTGTSSSTLSVSSQDSNGQALNGFYTVLYQNSFVQNTGFTPVSFTLNNNQQYAVQVQDYGGYYFSHWLDTGSVDRNRSVSLESDNSLIAVYSTSPSQSPDFALSASPASTSVNQGSSASSTITITPNNGFNSPVALSASSSIPGVTITFSPSSVTPATDSSAASTMTVTAASNASPGTYMMTISGSSSYSLLHTTQVSITVNQPISQTSQVSINSVDSNNNALSGYYTVLYQNGAAVHTGFTPATFSTSNGQTYSVEVQDYGSYHFDHWSDGSTNRDKTFTATSSAQTFTAVYSTGSDGGGGSGGSGGTTSQLSVQTFDSAGNQINGYYVTLWQNGNVVASGFSPTAFTINNNQQYQVAVADYGSESFNHWENGSTDRMYSVDITSSASTSVIAHAYYNP